MDTFAIATAMTGGAGQVVADRATRYKGLTLRETGGAALTIRLWDNAAAASGTIIETVSVPANGSVSIALPGSGVLTSNGLYLERVTAGAYEGSVRLG